MFNLDTTSHLHNCKLVILPYWLVDILAAHNKPISILRDPSELRAIITGTDLDFYTRHIPWTFDALEIEDKFTLQAIESTVSVTPPEFCYKEIHQQQRKYDGNHQHNYMSSDVSNYVRPLRDGVLLKEHPFLFDVYVIDDHDHESGDLILGISLRSAQKAGDIDSEINCISNFIGLLSKYYGISRIATTELMSRYISLKNKISVTT